MSVHHWGENPDGTWILEIHNDAYSKWASDAKFFRWSLNFHGVEFDPNDPASGEDPNAERFNVVREADSGFKDAEVASKKLQEKESAAKTTTTTPKPKPRPRGCVSKNVKCTRDVNDCRTFAHRRVAGIFCECTKLCLEITPVGGEEYNMQCEVREETGEGEDEDDAENEISDKETPFFCQFIPFFSY